MPSSWTSFRTPPQSGQANGEGSPGGSVLARGPCMSILASRSMSPEGSGSRAALVPASFESSGAMSASFATWSGFTYSSALRGMSGQNASSGSCTTVTAPRCLSDKRPAVPSSSAPVSTTPMARGP